MFYNLPVRRRSMVPRQELDAIRRVVEEIAIAAPNVLFSLVDEHAHASLLHLRKVLCLVFVVLYCNALSLSYAHFVFIRLPLLCLDSKMPSEWTHQSLCMWTCRIPTLRSRSTVGFHHFIIMSTQRSSSEALSSSYFMSKLFSLTY